MMRKLIIMIMLISGLLALSCEKPLSELEATDSEALFNVMMIDNHRVSELDIIPSEIPDTLEYIAYPDTLNPIFWHVVDSTFETFEPVISSEPVETEVGSFYQAEVTFSITRLGMLHILKYNNAADSLERYERAFSLTGTREAVCLKMGSTSRRRGWVLTSIGDAIFRSSPGAPAFFDYLYYHAGSKPDSVFEFGSRSLNDLVSFNHGEELRLQFDYPDTSYRPIIFVPYNTYYYRRETAEADSSGGYKVVFNLPTVINLYGQLKFLLVNIDAASESYEAAGYSYNYRVQ